MPNGKCRMHGGLSPAGAASPRFKTGKFSRYLPERLLERYEEAQNDETLLELRDEIALIDTRLLDLLSRVDTGESGALWKKLQALWAAYKREENTDRGTDLLMQIGQAIAEGAADYAAWDDVNKQLTLRKGLAESQRKREIELKQSLSTEQAMLLIAQLTDIIRRHVIDPATRAAIASELVQLTGREPRGIADGG